MVVVDPEKQKGQAAVTPAEQRASRRSRTRSSFGLESSQDLGLIKDRLAELFTPGKLREQSQEAVNDDKGKSTARALLQWTEGFQPRGKGEISESCRNAFTAACHLLLESTTFPVYYTEKESQELHSSMFENITGTFRNTYSTLIIRLDSNETDVCLFFFFVLYRNEDNEQGGLPEWLRSLMTLCCISKDYQVQLYKYRRNKSDVVIYLLYILRIMISGM